jgi:hypothetical protein
VLNAQIRAPHHLPVYVADLLEMEMAWYLLTVVVRLGRPAAASDLAATTISPRMVERMNRVPESPLCLSDGGAVTASQTAIVAFLRLVGLDVPAPRVSLSSYDVRRWWGGDADYVCAEAEGLGRGALRWEEVPPAGSRGRLFRFPETIDRSICISVLYTCCPG